VGTHFTYGSVPLTEGLRGMFGRNPYDRIVHFGFGLLLFEGIHAVLFRKERREHFTTELFFVFGVIAAIGVAYELVEWLTTGTVSGRVSVPYLGSQGDIWDSQKDMAANSLGALLGAFVLWWRRRARR
jgi:putative membrane protein